MKSAYDEIFIRHLHTRCTIGVHPEERKQKQDVSISISLFGDFIKACMHDDIEDTVDYSALEHSIVEMVQESSFFLVERLAERIAEVCLDYERVHKVTVTVEKPEALARARSVGITITREKVE
jgi:FolB domain-containing protein